VIALATHGAGAWNLSWQAMPQFPLMWSQILRHVFASTPNLNPRMIRHGDEVDVTIEALNQDGAPRRNLKITAGLIGPDFKSTDIALTETSAGHYAGRTLLNLAGDFNLRVAAEGATAEAPLHVAFPALYALQRANADRLTVLAATTGGRVINDVAQIFVTGDRRWVKRDVWQVWTLIALALFLTGLIIRYASGFRRGKRLPEMAR
jgi:hypothetical protein